MQPGKTGKRKCPLGAPNIKQEPLELIEAPQGPSSEAPVKSKNEYQNDAMEPESFNFSSVLTKFDTDVSMEPETELVETALPVVQPTKKRLVEKGLEACCIEGVQFDIMGDVEIARCAELEVQKRELYYYLSSMPFPQGVLDLRLGCNRNDTKCETCGRALMECVGHWGYINLQLPVFHVGFFKYTIQLLYCICKRCSSLLLPFDTVAQLRDARLRRSDDPLARAVIFKRILSSCRKVTKCPACGARQGVIRRIVKPTMDQFMKLRHVVKYKEGGKIVIVEDELNPLSVLRLFEAIDPVHARILNIMDPQRLIISNLPVPPACIRPSVSLQGQGTTEDDLTCILSDIVELNNVMATQMQQGFQTNQVIGNWQFLQLQCTRLINADAPAVSQLLAAKHISKPGRGICQRLKGKEGRFRGNLSGKRVDFSARTVISPDPNIGIDEIVIPEYIARRLTFPEKVTSANLGVLQKAVLNGVSKWPGACYVMKRDGVKCTLRFANPKQVAESLQIGDIVERHLWNGDVVLFNRQPSLHRMSIMAHKARVMPGSTFRFNECVCNPYNADFDGDEMNLHMPQTYEARAEALHLMGVLQNITTPRNGDPLIAATQDFLSASYLLTSKDRFLSHQEFCQLLCYVGDGILHAQVPAPAIVYPTFLWTGKQVYTAILRQIGAVVNLECREREFQHPEPNLFGRMQPNFMCIKDGHVIISNSELLCGALAKKTLGASKDGLFYQLLRRHGPHKAADVMLKVSKLTSRWVSDFGMTIGLDDTTPSPMLLATKQQLLSDGYAKVELAIANAANIEPFPGCTRKETLELQVKGILDDLRNQAGKACNKSLSANNKPMIMFNSGAKGALINIAQMIACVGQQNVMGQRIHHGFIGRTLPHFEVGCIDAKSRGFVSNSFFSGLDPAEFWFHTMSGREGLIDTAVKTSETGYMQRRLMKALEDLAICYDYTVRTSDGQIVQFIYGDDGLGASGAHATTPKALQETLAHVLTLSRFQRTPTILNSRAPGPNSKGDLRLPLPSGDGDDENFECGIVPKCKLAMPPKVKAKASARASWRTSQVGTPLDEATSAQINRNMYAHWVVHVHLDPEHAKAPLFGDEVLDWVALLEPLCREPLPRCMQESVTSMDHTSEPRIHASSMEIDKRVNGCSMKATNTGPRFSAVLLDTIRQWAARLQTLDPEIQREYESSGMDLVQFRAFKIPPQDRISVLQIYEFLRCAWSDYLHGICEPGEAIGALGAQSIGEPGTQMTLKTFHFAGVASMNVTLGVPRIKEIINAASVIQTPIIEVPLAKKDSYDFAKSVRAKIERHTLEQVVHSIKQVYTPGATLLLVSLDSQYIQQNMLQLDASSVCAVIRNSNLITKFKLSKHNIEAPQKWLVSIRLVASEALLFQLNALVAALGQLVVCGVKDIKRCVVKREQKDVINSLTPGATFEYALAVEGYGLQQVLGIFGVDAHRVISNHVAEVAKVLGIEAARLVIVTEIKKSMDAYGIDIDGRYMKLLGDVMTFRGEVVGINRFGIQKMRASSLMLASFEETNEHLFQAAVHGRRDPIKGVSECIIMGKHIALGTGAFDLLYRE
ncbi:bifunctional RNA polymerase [Babesia duncani]|uniref:DNA-directed RNA polymerase subunit n=1 Tax=Babesia duncani TaxID=323732 RepID=A0AAD9UNW7_9APIC|nr:bifunctional RNA polymerase [Babesia duncani]